MSLCVVISDHDEYMLVCIRVFTSILQLKWKDCHGAKLIRVGVVGCQLVNVAVSGIALMRMRSCGQLVSSINPFETIL